MRLAFPIDGGRGYGVPSCDRSARTLRVAVELELTGGGDPEAALAPIARIVSLDHDGDAA